MDVFGVAAFREQVEHVLLAWGEPVAFSHLVACLSKRERIRRFLLDALLLGHGHEVFELLFGFGVIRPVDGEGDDDEACEHDGHEETARLARGYKGIDGEHEDRPEQKTRPERNLAAGEPCDGLQMELRVFHADRVPRDDVHEGERVVDDTAANDHARRVEHGHEQQPQHDDRLSHALREGIVEIELLRKPRDGNHAQRAYDAASADEDGGFEADRADAEGDEAVDDAVRCQGERGGQGERGRRRAGTTELLDALGRGLGEQKIEQGDGGDDDAVHQGDGRCH